MDDNNSADDDSSSFPGEVTGGDDVLPVKRTKISHHGNKTNNDGNDDHNDTERIGVNHFNDDGVYIYYHGKVHENENKHTIENIKIVGNEVSDKAFESCVALQSIQIPYHVTKLGKYCFENCTQLRVVTILGRGLKSSGASVSSSNKEENGDKNDENDIVVDDDEDEDDEDDKKTSSSPNKKLSMLQIIDDHAFHGCSNLERIEGLAYTESSLKRIGEYAFLMCRNLISSTTSDDDWFEIPHSVEEIGDYAFAHCKSLIRCRLSNGLQQNLTQQQQKQQTEIPSHLFYCCTSLKEIVIPTSYLSKIQKVGIYAFYDCNALENNINTILPTTSNNLEIISRDAYHNCYAITGSIYLPSTIKEIHSYAFNQCKNIQHITLSSTCITEFGIAVFSDCINLQTVDFSNCTNLIQINREAFVNCSSLRAIQLPTTGRLKHIEEYAFYGCSKLQTITLPTSLEMVGTEAFYECPLLDCKVFNTTMIHHVCDLARGGRRYLERGTRTTTTTIVSKSSGNREGKRSKDDDDDDDKDDDKNNVVGSTKEISYPSSLWPLILYRVLNNENELKMKFPMNIIRESKYDDTNDGDVDNSNKKTTKKKKKGKKKASNENIINSTTTTNNNCNYVTSIQLRQISIVYFLMVHGIAMEK